MSTAPSERYLAAIVAADVVGYSRLMGADERGTLAALKAHRRELIDPLIARHKGDIVKTTGDGLLLKFASVVEAVPVAWRCRPAWPSATEHPAAERLEFRVGINIGGAIVEARRVRRRRQHRGTARTDRAAGQPLPVRGRLPASSRQARYARRYGRQTLKNISHPSVYRIEPSVRLPPSASPTAAPDAMAGGPWRGGDSGRSHGRGRRVRRAARDRPDVSRVPRQSVPSPRRSSPAAFEPDRRRQPGLSTDGVTGTSSARWAASIRCA